MPTHDFTLAKFVGSRSRTSRMASRGQLRRENFMPTARFHITHHTSSRTSTFFSSHKQLQDSIITSLSNPKARPNMQDDTSLTNSPRDLYDFEKILREHKEQRSTKSRTMRGLAKDMQEAEEPIVRQNPPTQHISPARKLRRMKRQLLLKCVQDDVSYLEQGNDSFGSLESAPSSR